MEGVLKFLSGWVDDTVPEEDLYGYIEAQLNLLATEQSSEHAEHESVLEGIRIASERLGRLTALPIPNVPGGSRESTPIGNLVTTGPPVRKGRISIEALQALQTDSQSGTKDSQSLEKLLRHVEVRRRAALQFDPAASEMERWQWAAELSLIFSRYAMQTRDFRYLNAAMKLNDWTFAYCQKRSLSRTCCTFLLALMEAEATMLEMTG
jgi:hypothetical protein